ncbi:nuclear transport factor 2 family protein [Phaeobacter sp. QD34_3]|uniref:nuclear transport factor 2 family protein n=1 Tax=unclassified Phaeobacter TaxID=2621772 RepID=UPI00237EEDBC|nr:MULTISPECIES: nuclear transport factor 2 family protein [unclassified Phaeobacter]MDE4131577.1 nuclear transport factor 2 family protein [Phaeobacter sp. QD34_3]MDE4135334.1 nuclear transport factor 2 family protein [Phaeobacter sp. QD34_24]MDE4174654.1 nuclear transport factor 2 family protein [Phaeobacter sp. PT47_59]
MTTPPSRNLEIVKHWFHELWEEADTAAIQALAQSGTKMHGPISDLGTPHSDYGEVVRALNNLLQNIVFEYANPIEQGEWIAFQLIVNADSVATGQSLRFSGHISARVTDGQVAEIFSTMDYMTMFEKLGQLPEESLPICLTGERLIWAK